MGKITCRSFLCRWQGSEDFFFEHFEKHHRHLIKEIDTKENKFEFTFEEFKNNIYLLVGDNGLYWLQNSENSLTNMFQSGIYSIGEFSFEETYYFKFGKIANGRCQIDGPFLTRKENAGNFDVEISYSTYEKLTKCEESSISIHFGKYELEKDKNDIYHPCSDDINWLNEKETAANEQFMEMFKCHICSEVIKKNLRFCDNTFKKHFYCDDCLQTMLKKKLKLRCYCKGYIPYDSIDPTIENILKMMKFE